MEVALSTSKRKFHKLLENISARKSQTNLSSLRDPANASTISVSTRIEPSSKRSRLSGSSFEDMSRPTSSTGVVRESTLATPSKQSFKSRPNSIRVVGTPKKDGDSQPRKTPHYNPWSQEHFLQRLETFADVKRWTVKPDTLDEVHWAKRGWICDAINTVACKGGCEKRVVVRIRPMRKDAEGNEIPHSEDYGVEVDEELIKKYQEIIVTGHDENCLWRRSGCKDNIYHLPMARDLWLGAFVKRLQTYQKINKALPPASSFKFPETPDSDLLRKALLRDVDGVIPPPEDPISIIFPLALLGWSGGQLGDKQDVLVVRCDSCFQRVGLWLYEEKRLAEAREKYGGDDDSYRLDVLEQHRHFCPWKNAEAQANPAGRYEGMSYYDTLRSMVSEYIRHQQRKYGFNSNSISTTGGSVMEHNQDDAFSGRPETPGKSAAERDEEQRSKIARARKSMSLLFRSKSLRKKIQGTQDSSRPATPASEASLD